MWVASHSQVIMAKFALGVGGWLNKEQFDFDFEEAAGTLDSKQMSTITDWLNNPFWP